MNPQAEAPVQDMVSANQAHMAALRQLNNATISGKTLVDRQEMEMKNTVRRSF